MAASADTARKITITSSLKEGTLKFGRLKGVETLGQPFSYAVDVYSEDPEIPLAKVLGTAVSIECPVKSPNSRYFHGLVENFAEGGKGGEYYRYRMTLRPWLWFLTRATDCHIFQNMTAVDIIKQVFRDRGFSDFKESLAGKYRTREYCVQYRESDYGFVSRLMEEEGIYYYFTHEKGKHTLVLSDSSNSHQKTPLYETVDYLPRGGMGRVPDSIYKWLLSGEIKSGKCTLRDFDYLNPQTNLEVVSTISRTHAHAAYEVYDYPGLYAVAGDGDNYVATRLQELQADYEQAEATGSPRGLMAGSLFELKKHPRKDQNREYLVISAEYDVVGTEYGATFGVDVGAGFHLKLLTLPSATQFRPRRLTPKPFVRGPQTAIVVGKQGEEIWTDEHGRVKVQFHWDRLGKKDENSSCWIRVSSAWAGNTWGAIQLPRMGQEVVVDFLEGDPDRPIITGRVYNAEQKPPYTLPANKTQSTIKSRSSKQGTTATFNELRFEDKKDAEEVYFHAEKDFNRVVENNDTLKVGFDKKDKGDQTIEIHNNQKLVVGNANSADGSQTVEIWKNRTVTIKEANEKLQVQKGNRDVIVDKGYDKHQVLTGNRDVIVSKGNDTHDIQTGNREVKIAKGNDTLTISMGNQTVKITAGSSTTEAGQSIELKVGTSSIKIDPASITLKAAMIKIEGTATVDVKAPATTVKGDAKVDVAAPMATVSGDGMLILKGGLLKIN